MLSSNNLNLQQICSSSIKLNVLCCCFIVNVVLDKQDGASMRGLFWRLYDVQVCLRGLLRDLYALGENSTPNCSKPPLLSFSRVFYFYQVEREAIAGAGLPHCQPPAPRPGPASHA